MVMDDREHGSTDTGGGVRRAPSPLMFWLLAGLAGAAFAPCVIVPVLLEYRAIKVAERLEADAVEAMRDGVVRQQSHLDALRQDPLAIARLARRDLSYQRPSEKLIAVPVRSIGPERSVNPLIADIDPPDSVKQLLSWLPYSERLDLYGDPATRLTIMCLSASLLTAAFWLYSPRRRLTAGT